MKIISESKLDIIKIVNFLHSQNIYAIFWTFVVLKFDKSNDVKRKQS